MPEPALQNGLLVLPGLNSANATSPHAALSNDAVAQAPEAAPDDPVVQETPAATEEAVDAFVAENARQQLGRYGLRNDKIERVYEAAEIFNKTVGDNRTIDELMLALIWLSESGALLDIKLDPDDKVIKNRKARIDGLVDLSRAPPEALRVVLTTMVGAWGFGLDDIVQFESDANSLKMASATKRWSQRMRTFGDWPHSVPFAGARVRTTPSRITRREVITLSITGQEAVGFLVAVAARYTKQLYMLPDELALRGVNISTDITHKIPQVEPLLAYFCYFQRAPKTAAIWETLLFLREFCEEVELARATSSGHGHDLEFVIPVLNRWLPVLRDTAPLSIMNIMTTLVHHASTKVEGGRTGHAILEEVAGLPTWNPTIPVDRPLEPTEQGLLEELVDAWSDFALRVAVDLHGVPPAELFYEGAAADAEIGPLLFQNTFRRTGFGARNFGDRYKRAAQMPLGADCTKTF